MKDRWNTELFRILHVINYIEATNMLTRIMDTQISPLVEKGRFHETIHSAGHKLMTKVIERNSE
jgi:hypothetical protein